MANEALINRLYQTIDEIARLGGEQERTSIVPNILVANASPSDLPTGYIKIVNPRDGTYVPCLAIAGLIVSDGDLVNVLFAKGTEPIALSQGSGSSSSSVKVSQLWESDFDAVAWQTNATGDLSAAGAYDLTTTGDLTGANVIVADDVIHSGDTDTLRSFTDDAIADQAGGVILLRLTETVQDLVEIGDVGGAGDVDININAGDVFIEGSTGRMGIGTTSPPAVLTVDGASGVGVAQMRFRDKSATRYRVDLNIAAGGGGGEFTAYDDTGAVFLPLGFLGNPVYISQGKFGVNIFAGLSGQAHVDQSSTTAAIPTVTLDQADLSEEFIEFITTVGAGNPIDTAAIGAYYGKVRVSVSGIGFKYIPLHDS